MRSSPALVRLAFGLVCCLLAGVALAGLAFPVIGGLGLIGKSAADDLSPQKPPALVLAQSSTILDRNGKVIATLFTENRRPVKLAEVPVNARRALIAIEDSRFYEHRGLDVKGTARALARNSSSGTVQQGGSTLTQQYVKNLLIESAGSQEAQKAAVQRSLRRKIQEARYALYLEEHMTKDQILEAYLNIAYYGSGVYGIGTAARHYFSVPVDKLTLAQGALLAGMMQNPRKYDPADNPRTSLARRNTVLARMLDLKMVTKAQHDVAVHEPLRLKVSSVSSGCEAPGVTAPFFCDYVRRYLENGPDGKLLGTTRQERQQRLLSGGLTIHTTLDPVVQLAAERAVNQRVPANDPFGAVAVADTVEPGTGAVRAMAVDRVFGSQRGQTKVNFALGGSAGFQGGSTFKAFVLARALQQGISPSLTLHAPARYCPKAFSYVTASGRCPSNAGDSEAGVFSMVSATWASVNTYFIQLEEKTGLVGPPELAESLGVHQVDGSFSGGSLPKTNPSFVLGSPEISPLAMAGAYAAFAAEGKYCPPHPVTSITDAAGRQLSFTEPACSQPLEPNVANTLTGILRGVIDGPMKGRTGAGASIGRPAAGKTGTTNDSTAAWFIGYTPQLATAVWVGKSTPSPMTHVTIAGRFYRQVYGGTIPAAIWRQLMHEALTGVPVRNFAPPGKPIGVDATTTVPNVRAFTVTEAAAILREAGYGVGLGPIVDDPTVAAGLVTGTSPAAGTPALPGTTVLISTSSGRRPAPVVTSYPTPAPRKTPKPKPSNPTPSPTPSATESPTPDPTQTNDPPGKP